MEIVELPAFDMIGIEARTSFQKEHEGAGTFEKQWGRVHRETVISSIPNRADNEVLSLYTDYESDLYGEYTFVIGARVTSTDTVPEGMVARHVPAANYCVFTSDRGPIGEIVIDTWKKIWESDCARSYRYDFEVYGANASDPAASVVDIYVGTRLT
jgi:predicted transcriptional regulator YdeE